MMMSRRILRGVFWVMAISFMVFACISGFERQEDGMYDSGLKSPQYWGGKFRNDREWKEPSISESLPLIWEYFFGDEERIPKSPLPLQYADLTFFNGEGSDQLNSTWLGHSSLLINIDGFRIMTDPVFEKRISIIGPSRFNGDVPVKIQEIPEIDAVLISHDHYDHLNKFTIQQLNPKTRVFIVPLRVGERLLSWGIPRAKIVELDWWEEYRLDNGLMIAATPSQHFSGRSLTGRYKTLWASWVMAGPRHKIFFSGDSGYFDGFGAIGQKYGPFDMTFLECGAYNEKWHFVHMFPEEVVKAHIDLKGSILHPIHWGTFNLSLHSWDDPMRRLAKAATAAGISIATPIVGDTIVNGSKISSRPWWEDAD